MSNELFEKKLAQELKGLSMQPSGAVWPQVEKRIQKERKRKLQENQRESLWKVAKSTPSISPADWMNWIHLEEENGEEVA